MHAWGIEGANRTATSSLQDSLHFLYCFFLSVLSFLSSFDKRREKVLNFISDLILIENDLFLASLWQSFLQKRVIRIIRKYLNGRKLSRLYVNNFRVIISYLLLGESIVCDKHDFLVLFFLNCILVAILLLEVIRSRHLGVCLQLLLLQYHIII